MGEMVSSFRDVAVDDDAWFCSFLWSCRVDDVLLGILEA